MQDGGCGIKDAGRRMKDAGCGKEFKYEDDESR